MHLVLTGSTGFIGRNLAPRLLSRGHSVLALCRDRDRARERLPPQVEVVLWDMVRGPPDAGVFRGADLLIHLAWMGLNRTRDPVHLEANLPASLALCRQALDSGVDRLLMAGSCLEYGPGEGARRAEEPTDPRTAYARAKDRLRTSLLDLQGQGAWTLQWARMFFLYGPWQNPWSLLPLLDAAIDRGDAFFPMSSGLHARDYMPVERVVDKLLLLVEDRSLQGVLNVCSGHPTTIRALVDDHIRRRGATIQPRPGSYPDPDPAEEPFAFWGVPSL